MNCEQVEERLSAYLDNVLAAEERREITLHLQSCSRCMMLLAELRQNDILLAQLPRVVPLPALHERIFSTPEMLELARTFSSQPFFIDEQTQPLAPTRRNVGEGSARPQFVSLAGGRGFPLRTIEMEIPPTPPTMPLRPSSARRKKRRMLTPMKMALAAILVLTLGLVGLLSFSLRPSTPGANLVGAITPPAAGPEAGQAIPLAAGTRFVFLRDGALWSTLVGGANRQPERLTPSSVAVASGWIVSPVVAGHTAGDMLAYIDLQSATVHTIRSDGQQDTPVGQALLKAGTVSASLWSSAAGETILSSLEWSETGDMLAFVGDPTGSGRTTLYLYSLATDRVQEVSTGLSGDIAHLAWSPDGTRLAFTVTHDGGESVLDYNVQSQKALDLSNLAASQGNSVHGVVTLGWSSSTSEPVVTWSLGSIGHISSVWLHHVGAGATVYPRLLLSGDYLQALYSQKADSGVGGWLVVATVTGQAGDIWRIDLTPGAGLIPLSRGKQVSFATWSPNSSTIFYLDGQNNGVGSGHLVNAATGVDHLLANDIEVNPAPAWSLDSLRLAYSTGTRINIVNTLTGSRAIQLQLRGQATDLSWSPSTASQMVVVIAGSASGIYLVDTLQNSSLQVARSAATGQIQWTEIP